MRIILQAAGKEVAHKANNLVVVAERMALLDWGIVLVDDDDRGNPIMGMEHPGQIQEDHGHIRFAGRPLQDFL